MINPNIFRAYDIRGIYKEDLTKESAFLIGQGIGTYIKKLYTDTQHPEVVVGRDNRTHGEELQQACIEGIQSTGCNITDIGLSPSPLLYFSVASQDFDAGVNVTASHNPKEYNGFKVVGRKAHSICGDEIQEIRKIIETSAFSKGQGSRKQENYFSQYIKTIQEKIQLKKPIKVVIDAGNGIAGKFYPEVFRTLGCEVVELYCELDGEFPNHEPDPIVEENLRDLMKLVQEEKADLGLAFDGDGDRVGIVDENGVMHDANQLLIILAEDILKREQTNVVYTVSCSSTVPEEVNKAGGKAVMVPVGHSYVEQAMRKENALIGGEQSGHFFIAENYFSFDDACYTAGYIARITSQSNGISEVFNKLPKVYANEEVRPDCADNKKFAVIETITEKLKENFEVNTMDGVRIEFGEGAWASIRASNTSPKLSICTEARSEAKLEEIDSTIWKTLEENGIKKP